MNQRLIDFIRKHRASGRQDAEITQFLLSRGHTKANIDLAFLQISNEEELQKTLAEKGPEKPEKKRGFLGIFKKKQPK